MKKNVMLKIASVLMVAVLLTTCAISSTFAKYTSTTSASATARVARWGVTADMTISDLFGTSYSSDDGKVTSSNTENVIAPGTYDKVELTTQIKGQPEVSVAVDYTATLTLDGFDTWCPLVFYVNGTKVETDGSAADLKAKLEAKINALDVTADPGTNLNDLADITIEWEWPFEAADSSAIAAQDAKDNGLGNAGLAGDGTFDLEDQATVTLDVAVTINQTGPAAVKA